jgi:hypothetical protein
VGALPPAPPLSSFCANGRTPELPIPARRECALFYGLCRFMMVVEMRFAALSAFCVAQAGPDA